MTHFSRHSPSSPSGRRNGRKILLAITDGGDNSSSATLREAVDALVQSEAVVYPIGIFDAANQDQNPQVLAQIADVTGGESFLPTTLPDISRICVEIAADVRRQYTLGFAGAEDGQYHQIVVTASDPKHGPLTVHTRPGYFGLNPTRKRESQRASRAGRRGEAAGNAVAKRRPAEYLAGSRGVSLPGPVGHGRRPSIAPGPLRRL